MSVKRSLTPTMAASALSQKSVSLACTGMSCLNGSPPLRAREPRGDAQCRNACRGDSHLARALPTARRHRHDRLWQWARAGGSNTPERRHGVGRTRSRWQRRARLRPVPAALPPALGLRRRVCRCRHTLVLGARPRAVVRELLLLPDNHVRDGASAGAVSGGGRTAPTQRERRGERRVARLDASSLASSPAPPSGDATRKTSTGPDVLFR